jgi:hypothetical protein
MAALTVAPWLMTSAMNELQRPTWVARLRQAKAEINARGLFEDEEDRTAEQRAWRDKQRKKQHGTRALVCDDSVLADMVPIGIEATVHLRALLSLAFGGDFPAPRRPTVKAALESEKDAITKILKRESE